MEGEELAQKVSAFILGLLLFLSRGCRIALRDCYGPDGRCVFKEEQQAPELGLQERRREWR